MKKYWNAKTKKLMTEEEMKKTLKGKKVNDADGDPEETKKDGTADKEGES